MIASKFLRRTTARTILKKIFLKSVLRNFAFYNFCLNLGFQCTEEACATWKLFLISGSIITVSKLHKKPAVRTIFRKNWNLWNFAFYNPSWNLDFQPFEKNLTTLQLLRILHDINIISKFLRKIRARAIFKKSVFQNFVYHNSW